MNFTPLSLRMLVLTDTHGGEQNLRAVVAREINSVDAVVFCGDAAPYFDPSNVSYLIGILDAIEKPVILVPGNMDDPKSYRDTDNIRVIHKGIALVNGYAFLGIGGSTPTPFGTVFELSEEEIERALSSLWMEAAKLGPVILVSHAPPYDTACDIASGGRHVGSRALRRFIERYSPLLCLCGHIHESRAIDRVDGTIVVNPGPLRDGFYALVELRGFEVKRIELRRL
ncbi:MAG: YfcE family phosphodiesterase [Crenarchaeota archaeon]|nr:YfcE family phosphodiesterase [Thermoproteota archaeon]